MKRLLFLFSVFLVIAVTFTFITSALAYEAPVLTDDSTDYITTNFFDTTDPGGGTIYAAIVANPAQSHISQGMATLEEKDGSLVVNDGNLFDQTAYAPEPGTILLDGTVAYFEGMTVYNGGNHYLNNQAAEHVPKYLLNTATNGTMANLIVN